MKEEAFIKHIINHRGKRTWVEYAADLHVPVSQLHMVANGKKTPEPKIVASLGFKREVNYIRTEATGGNQ